MDILSFATACAEEHGPPGFHAKNASGAAVDGPRLSARLRICNSAREGTPMTVEVGYPAKIRSAAPVQYGDCWQCVADLKIHDKIVVNFGSDHNSATEMYLPQDPCAANSVVMLAVVPHVNIADAYDFKIAFFKERKLNAQVAAVDAAPSTATHEQVVIRPQEPPEGSSHVPEARPLAFERITIFYPAVYDVLLNEARPSGDAVLHADCDESYVLIRQATGHVIVHPRPSGKPHFGCPMGNEKKPAPAQRSAADRRGVTVAGFLLIFLIGS